MFTRTFLVFECIPIQGSAATLVGRAYFRLVQCLHIMNQRACIAIIETMMRRLVGPCGLAIAF